jgi:hypothetical protein
MQQPGRYGRWTCFMRDGGWRGVFANHSQRVSVLVKESPNALRPVPEIFAVASRKFCLMAIPLENLLVQQFLECSSRIKLCRANQLGGQ